MGVAWLLLLRTFATRPKRTLLFLLGYGLATGVMITLLAVGEAVLMQARDKNLVGGGDLILVPLGIDLESLKVGGISAMYYSIPQARFIVRQMLAGNRFRNEIETISPYLYSEVLYARKPSSSQVETIFAEGSIPDYEKTVKQWDLPWKNSKVDEEWTNPSTDRFLNDIDRFHLPSSLNMPLDQWAEWHYFNFESHDFFGYLSFMVTGDIVNDRAAWIVSLQLYDREQKRYTATYPATQSELPLDRVNYLVGSNHVRIVDGVYELDLDFVQELRVKGKLKYRPSKNLYFPPVLLAKSEGFESGYVIPSLKGMYEGTLNIGGKNYDFNRASGYHDHNWGIWQQPESAREPVRWNWGHASSDSYSLFFGEIFVKNRSRGLFVGVFDNNGYVTVFQPGSIQFSSFVQRPEKLSVPQQLRISQKKPFTAIEMDGKAKSITASPLGSDNSIHFVQYKMDYRIRLNIDGKASTFNASGNAETFVKR